MERIGRYTVERVLGSGAFGTVWLARDEAVDTNVAIKVLADNWVQNEAVRQRFIDEARILFQIESDHIVRVHTVEDLPDGRPYFVMEYADRGSLEERMTERLTPGGWFTLDEALALSRDIALGLKVAHVFGIAHRDLKPANVMFRSIPAHLAADTDERLVLVDFGIAKSLATSGSTTIATGTPHYMAPEQSEGRADHRSDLYSAAVILYELLAGRVPYPVDSIGALIRAQSVADFPAIRTIRGDVTVELDAAIRRALAADPAARFADADAWLAALDDPASAVAPPAVASAAAAAAAAAGLRPDRDARARRTRAAARIGPGPAHGSRRDTCVGASIRAAVRAASRATIRLGSGHAAARRSARRSAAGATILHAASSQEALGGARRLRRLCARRRRGRRRARAWRR